MMNDVGLHMLLQRFFIAVHGRDVHLAPRRKRALRRHDVAHPFEAPASSAPPRARTEHQKRSPPPARTENLAPLRQEGHDDAPHVQLPAPASTSVLESRSSFSKVLSSPAWLPTNQTSHQDDLVEGDKKTRTWSAHRARGPEFPAVTAASARHRLARRVRNQRTLI